MALGIGISVLNDKALERKLAKIPGKMQKKIMKKAMRIAFRPVLTSARVNAPAGPTGQLKRKIRLRAVKGGKDFVGMQVRTGTRQELGILGNSKWYYPAHIETGTRFRKANPFLRNALKSNAAAVLLELASQIRKGLKTLAG